MRHTGVQFAIHALSANRGNLKLLNHDRRRMSPNRASQKTATLSRAQELLRSGRGGEREGQLQQSPGAEFGCVLGRVRRRMFSAELQRPSPASTYPSYRRCYCCAASSPATATSRHDNRSQQDLRHLSNTPYCCSSVNTTLSPIRTNAYALTLTSIAISAASPTFVTTNIRKHRSTRVSTGLGE